MKPSKVFGIGFPKTGTSSLGRALQILGYRLQKGVSINKPDRPWIDPPITRQKLFDLALPYSAAFDAFEDFPWMCLYREMDGLYPGSKFILTVRDSDTWADSTRNHAPVLAGTGWRYLAGEDGPEASHEQLLDAYYTHNETIWKYFKDRPDDLLIFPVELANWRELCDFLGCKRPFLRKYPHRNKRASRPQT